MGDIAQFFQAEGDWTEVAFETTSLSVPVGQNFGASVVGSKCGVHGQGTRSAQRHTKIVPEGTGVIGRGDVYGVYGIGSTITSSDTPDFNAPPPSEKTQPIGTIGVNGASEIPAGGPGPAPVGSALDAPAIFGDNNILATDTAGSDDLHSGVRDAVTEGIQTPVGVEGMSYHGYGVVGVSLTLSPAKDKGFPTIGGRAVHPDVHEATHGLIHDQATNRTDINPTAGVLGLSVEGYGVRGVSRLERGGVFQSATARYFDIDPLGVSESIGGPIRAQVRLVPHYTLDTESPGGGTAYPVLPGDGETGDLLCLVTPLTNNNATLWFCEKGGDGTNPASWRLVQLADSVSGKY